jgi:hypothetical protein
MGGRRLKRYLGCFGDLAAARLAMLFVRACV